MALPTLPAAKEILIGVFGCAVVTEHGNVWMWGSIPDEKEWYEKTKDNQDGKKPGRIIGLENIDRIFVLGDWWIAVPKS